jgi:anti-sigma factor RsiW
MDVTLLKSKSRILLMNTKNSLSREVQKLVWALLDEQASKEQVQRLQTLLAEDDEARQIYVMCIQMHADSHHLFQPPKLQLPPDAEKAIQAKKVQRSRLPASLLNLPPAPAGMPIMSGAM